MNLHDSQLFSVGLACSALDDELALGMVAAAVLVCWQWLTPAAQASTGQPA